MCIMTQHQVFCCTPTAIHVIEQYYTYWEYIFIFSAIIYHWKWNVPFCNSHNTFCNNVIGDRWSLYFQLFGVYKLQNTVSIAHKICKKCDRGAINARNYTRLQSLQSCMAFKSSTGLLKSNKTLAILYKFTYEIVCN